MLRYIPFKYYDPYERLALNEYLISYVRNTKSMVISLTGWDKPCVNIGYGQKFSEVVNTDYAKENNILLLRRQGGGGATYLSQKDICWGIVGLESEFPSDLNQIYIQTANIIIEALKQMGISAKHKPVNDVATESGKISGATVVKKEGVVYISGTLLYEVNRDILSKLLMPENDYLKKSKPESKKNVTSISEESTISFEDAVKIVSSTLLEKKEFVEEPFTQVECEQAKVNSQKYKSSEWLFYNDL